MSKEIRVRIAPSPTGNLHIGTARTALFNWLFAKHKKGTFVLRIEDTDLERSDPKYEKDILDGLKWLGLEWDEFYKQSERMDIYEKYIQKLLNDGKAFWCYHTKEELEQEQKEQMANKLAPRHICDHKYKIPQNKEGGIIRLNVDEKSDEKIKFNDIIRGEIEFEEKLLGDLSIAKNEKTPLYNFAVVVDDHETKISHVIRGEDHIPNTPKQILIGKALGFHNPSNPLGQVMPEYAHLPLILGSDKSKMSKRHGATSITEYNEEGYLPEAMFNYMAFLGWTPKDSEKEIMDKDEIIKNFDLKNVHKSGAVFNLDKLNWINSQYIKNLSDEELITKILVLSSRYQVLSNKENTIKKILPMIKERMEKLSDIKEFLFFFKDPEYEKDLLMWKKYETIDIQKTLEMVKELVTEIGVGAPDTLREKLDDLASKLKTDPDAKPDRGLVYWPFRVSLSGQKGSPDPVDIAVVLGQEEVIKRINKAIQKLK
ncbi:MAG: glutamate--tRNA ligase [Candidatus Yanofskybacteria bacterium CG10_big_fil_rev_8_21_14_0_10_36_16]|uniref:Glutamate--tRNA ligase n=1 Tax=Candidatus Yanofskybacteria bacterium CG10_big_fil_rev_8_21_14_0_10_36_16 TaxID=1975096 RepID=A0A2J0QA06_9BACT|nr:MAG: glutamate--tRNA ligase [Candidatus Yanofskybacteria bacterium CG10_big_fil_rev_8_21_14_0_10_36_16]